MKNILSYSKLLSNNRIIPHSEQIISIISGSLLGETYLEKLNNNVRVSFQQESSNMEYLNWVWSQFSIWNYTTNIKPIILKKIGRKGKIIRYLKFNTFPISSWNYLYNDWYWDGSGRKRIPKNISEYLTPLALAVWVMYNGSKVNNELKFTLNGFIAEDIEVLAQVLKSKYKLNISIHNIGAENNWIIYIKQSSISILRSVVEDFIISSMRYKFSF